MHPKLATCAVLIAGCALTTVFVKPAAATIVYTPVNTTLTGTGHIKIDLNHDGIKDFDIQAAVSGGYCGTTGGGGVQGVVTITPTTGDGEIASGTNTTPLVSGIIVGPTGAFLNSGSLMTNFLVCRGGFAIYLHGNWCHRLYPGCSGSGYLGLRFLINGQIHYGWAYVTIKGGFIPGGLSVTLQSFAYETIAGRGITTGQTSGT